MSRRIGRVVGAAAVAVTIGALCTVFSGTAYAAPQSVLRTKLTGPPATVPGGQGVLQYTITNTGRTPTDGILLNVSLPPRVDLALSPGVPCQKTGNNPQGGALISCNFSDASGRMAPGESRVHNTPFTVAPDAPRGKVLGPVGALVVPLKGGKPTEDERDLRGPNVAWTPIRTP
ncbi:hypothetical protein [Pseudonocardia acaciae]|uniref:hypothetical protein n=1 Tax=Pseudonocardia acaciae TaxID=551276 RepID=UPI00056A861F|nr:hypothetical protein [Pseudonocardia acaciae]